MIFFLFKIYNFYVIFGGKRFLFFILLCLSPACADLKAYREGNELLKAGNSQGAIEQYKKALEASPQNVQYFKAYFETAGNYILSIYKEIESSSLSSFPEVAEADKKLKSADNILRETLKIWKRTGKELNKKSPDEYVKQKILLKGIVKKRKELKDAIKLRISSLKSTFKERYKQVWIYLKELKLEEAKNEVKLLLQLSPGSKKVQLLKKNILLLEKGLKAENSSMPEKALKIYRRVLKNLPSLKIILTQRIDNLDKMLKDIENMRKRADELYSRKRFSDAIAVYNQVLKINKEDKLAQEGLKLCELTPLWLEPSKLKDLDNQIILAEKFLKSRQDSVLKEVVDKMREEQARRKVLRLIKEANEKFKNKNFLEAKKSILKAMEIQHDTRVNVAELSSVKNVIFSFLLSERKKNPSFFEDEGCSSCHSPDLKHPFNKLIEDNKPCLSCHDSPLKDNEKPHPAVSEGSCTDCHDYQSSFPGVLRDKIPNLCYSCHERKDEKMYVHSAVLLGRCTKCHKPHSSPNPSLLIAENGKDICFACHYDDISRRRYIHPLLSQGGTCTDCHDPHQSSFKKNLKNKNPELCYECHESKVNGKNVHSPVKSGRCVKCHNPHASDNPFMLYNPINELCSSCHPDRADGFHIITGFKEGFHPVKGEKDPKREDQPFSCTSCHNPHSSDSPFLFYEGKNKGEMCRRCHTF